MFEAIRNRAAHPPLRAADRRPRAPAAGAAFAPSALLAAGCLVLAPAVQAADEDPAARDLSVEQTAVYTVQAPAPAAAAPDPLGVVAWVDHADNTYAVGEQVRLFVKASKDAYLTVLNVGASGRTTVLFPNAHQPETRVAANRVVEVPPPDSGTRIRVSGPTGRELIKVIATTHPNPLFAAAKTPGAGPFTALDTDTRSVARDLQVVMDTNAGQEWDQYDKIITTIASRPGGLVPMAPAPAGTDWPASPFGLRVATGKPVYRMGEPVSLYASADVPCYLTLVNVGSSGQVRVLLPNAAQPQNLLPAGRTVVFPVAASNLQLTPMGPTGVETVVAVCSTDNQPVFPAGLSYGQGGYAALDGREAVSRDLAVVAAAPAPNRRVGQATVGFVVTR